MTWPVVELRSVANIERVILKPDEIVAGTPYIGLDAIPSGGGPPRPVILSNGELASSKFRFQPGHVLFGKLRPYLAKVSLIDFGGVCSTDILPIRPGPLLDGSYLRHFLLHPDTVARAASLATGANLPRLSPAVLGEFLLPLPPIEEQRRIADILDRADVLRAKRRRAIADLGRLMQALFLHAFGDPATNPKGWQTTTVGEVCLLVTDGEHQTPRRTTEGIKLLSARNVRDGYLDFGDVDYIPPDEFARISARGKPTTGDILISCSGTIGRVASVSTDEPLALVRELPWVSWRLHSLGGWTPCQHRSSKRRSTDRDIDIRLS